MRFKLNSITPQSIWQWKIQGQDNLQAVHSKEKILALEFTYCVMNQGIHVT